MCASLLQPMLKHQWGGGLYLNVTDCWKCEVCQTVCTSDAIELTFNVTDPADADNVKQDDFIVKLFSKE